MKLNISKRHRYAKEPGDTFIVDDLSKTGTPIIGEGKTMIEAIGSYFHRNQRELGIEFEVDESAYPAEMRRRRTELDRR